MSWTQKILNQLMINKHQSVSVARMTKGRGEYVVRNRNRTMPKSVPFGRTLFRILVTQPKCSHGSSLSYGLHQSSCKAELKIPGYNINRNRILSTRKLSDSCVQIKVYLLWDYGLNFHNNLKTSVLTTVIQCCLLYQLIAPFWNMFILQTLYSFLMGFQFPCYVFKINAVQI